MQTLQSVFVMRHCFCSYRQNNGLGHSVILSITAQRSERGIDDGDGHRRRWLDTAIR